MKLPAKVKIKIEPWNGVKSPYDGLQGVALKVKDNIDKNGNHSDIYLVRLDRPPIASITIVGLPKECLVFEN